MQRLVFRHCNINLFSNVRGLRINLHPYRAKFWQGKLWQAQQNKCHSPIFTQSNSCMTFRVQHGNSPTFVSQPRHFISIYILRSCLWGNDVFQVLSLELTYLQRNLLRRFVKYSGECQILSLVSQICDTARQHTNTVACEYWLVTWIKSMKNCE